jgi:hypothetical protein
MSDSLVCMSVKEVPRPHVESFQAQCSICQQDVWVARNMYGLTTTMRVLCVQCAGDPKSWKV